MAKYIHRELNKFAPFGGSLYAPQKEVRLKYRRREVLYVIGETLLETACCGACLNQYTLVPGYIVKWQKEKNREGLPVSEVQPITDEATRQELSQLISAAGSIPQVVFS